MKYTNWLKTIKGYSDKTIDIYGRVAFELECSEGNWEKYISRFENKSSSTRRLMLSAIKSYYVFMKDKRAKDISLPKRELKVSDYVTYKEYQTYLNEINKRTKMGFQKYLIIRLLFETGIRSSELLWITKSCLKDRRIKIRGKGNKERYVIVSKWLWSDLNEYVKSIDSKRLFNFGYKNLYSKIQRLDKKRNLTPHMFRHGFARYCFKKGISIYDISLAMGHSSIDTTAKYINKNSEDVTIHTIF